jgi:hypothetical protein
METKQTFTPARIMEPVTVHVAGQAWQLSIDDVTRVGRELFVQIAIVGPEVVHVVVRARAIVRGRTARQILETVCDWLLKRGREDYAVLDLPGSAA